MFNGKELDLRISVAQKATGVVAIMYNLWVSWAHTKWISDCLESLNYIFLRRHHIVQCIDTLPHSKDTITYLQFAEKCIWATVQKIYTKQSGRLMA